MELIFVEIFLKTCASEVNYRETIENAKKTAK